MRRLMVLLLVGGMWAGLCFGKTVRASTINVPGDQPTIQAGIDASVDGDTVLVDPGVYTANIDFLGKRIVVRGLNGAEGTTITPANYSESIVKCVSAEPQGTTLSGFTLTGTVNLGPDVIFIAEGCRIRVESCIFRDNPVNWLVINCSGSKHEFVRNVFARNGGVSCIGVNAGTAEITNNTFNSNSRGFYCVGGSVIAKNNIVANSIQYGAYGGPSSLSYNDFWNNNPDYSGGANGGTGSISSDPLFTDVVVDDYSLQILSPCINAGDPDPAYNDPDGSRNDMGAVFLECPTGDADCDSIPDELDNCVDVPNTSQFDSDGDLVGDACDNCPDVSNPLQINSDSDALGDICDNCDTVDNPGQEDVDGDSVGDACDNCPDDYNPAQTNSDGDGLGDFCDTCPYDDQNDIDGDGICGNLDNCPEVWNFDQADADNDGVGDLCDNCPSAYNPLQEETDGDGIADSCDNCPTTYNVSQNDFDHDGIGDVCDACPSDSLNDIDGDTVCGDVDNCPTTYNPDQADTNSNQIGDACECNCPYQADFDEDGFATSLDLGALIDILFAGSPDTQDSWCPSPRADFDCDGFSTSLDLAGLIDHLFAGAAGPCGPCGE